MQEILNQIRQSFDNMINICKSKGDDFKSQGIQATSYLMSMQDMIKKWTKDMGISNINQLSIADRIFYQNVKTMSKEYEDKFYEIAKPFIEDYFNLNTEVLKNVNASYILEKFNKVAELIDRDKNSQEKDENLKKAQISITKSFAYYVNREYEDKLDSKCRAKYYEILKQ